MEYRPVSGLAVVALLAGLCSAVALLSPLAWTVPLIGAGLAVAALADVRRGDGKSGRAAALIGLALSVGFGGQAVTGSITARWIAKNHASAVARTFVAALREQRLADAMSMSGPMLSALASTTPRLMALGADTDGSMKEAFAELEIVTATAGCGPGATVTVTEVRPDLVVPRAWVVRLEVAPCAGPAAELTLAVTVEAAPGGGGLRSSAPERWAVVAAVLAR